MKLSKILLGAWLLWGGGISWAADGGGVLLESSIDPLTARVGDRLVLTVQSTADAGVVLELPLLPKTLGRFEVVSVDPGAPVLENGRTRQTVRVTLTLFDVGVSTLPSLSLGVRRGGRLLGRQLTPEIPVTITSVLTPASKDIRGLKGQLPKVLNERFWVFLGVLGVLGLAAYGVFRHGQRKKRDVERPGPPPRPAHEIALEALTRLESSLEGPGKEFYSRLSEILRSYLEGRFAVPAMDRTTPEITQAMKHLPLTLDQRMRLREVLENSDLVKFAKFELSGEERLAHLIQIREFVQATLPRGGAPEAP